MDEFVTLPQLTDSFVIQHADGVYSVLEYARADMFLGDEVGPTDQLITWIYVSPAHRTRGIGSELLRRITKAADDKNIILWLEIAPHPDGPLNYADLLRWYQRHGFKSSRRFFGFMVRRPQLVS